MQQKNVYIVTYEGTYIYGYALVVANNEQEARMIFQEVNPKKIYNVTLIGFTEDTNVIDIYDGDY